MLKKLVVTLVLSVLTLVIAGCGGGASSEGATSFFEKAMVSFTVTPWTGETTVLAANNVDDQNSKVPLKIIITPYPNAIGTVKFTVLNMTYNYVQTVGGSRTFTIPDVNFDTSYTFNPILASARAKDNLVNMQFDVGGTTPRVFNVQATYRVLEDTSGKTHDYSVPLGIVTFR